MNLSPNGQLRTLKRWALRCGLAVAVLLAQNLVVSHDHDLVNDALGVECVVCLQLTTTDSMVPTVIDHDPLRIAPLEPSERPTLAHRARAILPQPRGPPVTT